MRKQIKILRILKINWVKDLSISVIFNNRESRIINCPQVLKKFRTKADSTAGILYDHKEFAKVKLIDNTLSWDNVEQFITMRNGKNKKSLLRGPKKFQNNF